MALTHSFGLPTVLIAKHVTAMCPYQTLFGQLVPEIRGRFACFWGHPCKPASPLGPQCRIALINTAVACVRDVMYENIIFAQNDSNRDFFWLRSL